MYMTLGLIPKSLFWTAGTDPNVTFGLCSQTCNSLNNDNEEQDEEDIELLHYNHGKISAEDTEARLWGKPKGTFLIR